MWSAKPGMQVVCIKEPGEGPEGYTSPKLNRIYTIRHVYRAVWPLDRRGEIGLRLEELRNPLYPPAGAELGYAALCFRPCAPTDIGALRALLAPQPARSRKVEVVE